MADRSDAFDVRSAFRVHQDVLLGFAVNALRDRPLAEDCVQETYLRAWRSRATYDPAKAGERTWLFAIARRVIADALTARGRAGPAVPLEQSGDVPAATPDPLTRLALIESLMTLPDEQRDAVVAVHVDGFSYADLAARTGVPVATLRTRVFYGLRALRSQVREPEGDHV